ncbi:hypothetical protein GUJ93_ZPchr0004g39072 [Zizania palustris]|uniref:Uncharacterized protein n=1 Tax=Zizania palustris TaxID=103762 RepID=A0A8J5V9S0_ZIZPA|nr:hypothetical protein GUJ93_ZPchr0004g39072 [Zizania palustris]
MDPTEKPPEKMNWSGGTGSNQLQVLYFSFSVDFSIRSSTKQVIIMVSDNFYAGKTWLAQCVLCFGTSASAATDATAALVEQVTKKLHAQSTRHKLWNQQEQSGKRGRVNGPDPCRLQQLSRIRIRIPIRIRYGYGFNVTADAVMPDPPIELTASLQVCNRLKHMHRCKFPSKGQGETVRDEATLCAAVQDTGAFICSVSAEQHSGHWMASRAVNESVILPCEVEVDPCARGARPVAPWRRDLDAARSG